MGQEHFFSWKKGHSESQKKLAKEDCALQGVQFENYQKCKAIALKKGIFDLVLVEPKCV